MACPTSPRTARQPSLLSRAARDSQRSSGLRRSRSPGRLDAELVRGDLETAVQQLKRESGKGLFVGGVKLPLALAELGLIDDYEFVVPPRLAGHGPTLFAGLSKLRMTRSPTASSGCGARCGERSPTPARAKHSALCVGCGAIMLDWVANQREWLSIEPLPGYAPDLNPIEQVWGNVKSQELTNLCADTIGEVSEAAEDGLHRISSDAPLCFAFLRHSGLRL